MMPQQNTNSSCVTKLGLKFILSHNTKNFEMWSNEMHIQSYRKIRELLSTHKKKPALKQVEKLDICRTRLVETL